MPEGAHAPADQRATATLRNGANQRVWQLEIGVIRGLSRVLVGQC